MRKPLIISVFGLLTLMILFLLFRQKDPFGSRNSSFSVDANREITRIELSDENSSLILQKKGDNWLVNGKDEARRSSIIFITRILKEVKIKSPVSPGKFEEEITGRGIKPVRVRVYRNSKLLKSFLVYKTRSNVYGNIMKMRSWSKPFIVYIPGVENNIGAAFTLHPLFWEPFMIFNHLPSEIAAIRVTNVADTSMSFEIRNRKKHNVALYSNGKELAGWDTTLVRRYLTYFTRIPFEQWAFNLPENEKKSIESSVPVTRIELQPVTGNEITLTLWQKTIDSSGVQIPDTDRLWGRTNRNTEVFFLRYFDVDPILKRKSWFFPE